jgi:mono/diheme cytochrome c family protein
MKLLRVTVRCSVLLVLSLPVPMSFAADAGAALYKARCAQCHGKNLEGRTEIKAPSLKSAEVRKMSDDDLKAMISQRTNGEMEKQSAHTLLKKRLTAEQVAEIVSYIREMQSK